MYSNRRREHIHIIRQFEVESGNYTGMRLVIFNNDGTKYIRDYDNFIKHKYKNPKSKVHIKSLWTVTSSHIPGVIKKEMINTDEDNKLRMEHVLYDSQEIPISEYYKIVFKNEKVSIDKHMCEVLTLPNIILH